jgi:protocatechuate 3,4-dioxygenase beta subunit
MARRFSSRLDDLRSSAFDRRSILLGASAGASALLLGCGHGTNGPESAPAPGGSAAAPTMPGGGPVSCVARAASTEGPYFRDLKLNRSDIRSDPTDAAVKPGLPLRLVIRVGQVEGTACKPLSGAVVDIWQCDAVGVYSNYEQEGTAGKQFLRGYQLTDGSGAAEFQSIYPGAYGGRAVHVHFKVRTNPTGAGRDFTSQLYFPEPVNEEVFAQAPYKAAGRVRNAQDGIFGARDRATNLDGTSLIPRMSKQGGGWLAELDIGIG